jgi:hypothetical protein
MTNFTPTHEQQECLTAFATGEAMTIEAGAGTGKTSTLRLLSESTDRTGLFIAFNKSVQLDAEASFPSNVECRTAHSLAYKGMHRLGEKALMRRLSGPRVTSRKTAEALGIPEQVQIGDSSGDEVFALRDFEIASAVMGTVRRYCYSADEDINENHVPTLKGRENAHDHVVRIVLPYARAAWTDLNSFTGKLKFNHDHYVKIWALSHPKLTGFDFIMLDEAQDTNPVVAAVFNAQTNVQKIVVGDRCQAIYEWRGARDAISGFKAPHHLKLSQSFRFGPSIATEANKFLGLLRSPLTLSGTDSIDSAVETVSDPSCIIARTNATVVQTAMEYQAEGRKVAIVGGTREIEAFAKAARELQEGRKDTYHADLAAFGCWGQLQAYVATDEGADLRVMVKLIDNYGVDTVLEVCHNSVDESTADLIVTTAHKAKGREWSSVRIANDFRPAEEQTDLPSVSELRLFYVAVTRAINRLDADAFSWIADIAAESATQEVAA